MTDEKERLIEELETATKNLAIVHMMQSLMDEIEEEEYYDDNPYDPLDEASYDLNVVEGYLLTQIDQIRSQLGIGVRD